MFFIPGSSLSKAFARKSAHVFFLLHWKRGRKEIILQVRGIFERYHKNQSDANNEREKKERGREVPVQGNLNPIAIIIHGKRSGGIFAVTRLLFARASLGPLEESLSL